MTGDRIRRIDIKNEDTYRSAMCKTFGKVVSQTVGVIRKAKITLVFRIEKNPSGLHYQVIRSERVYWDKKFKFLVDLAVFSRGRHQQRFRPPETVATFLCYPVCHFGIEKSILSPFLLKKGLGHLRNSYCRPRRRIPFRSVFSRVHRNLIECGSFQRSRGQGRPTVDYDFEDVLNRIEENPQISLRTLENITNIPKSIIGRMTRMQGLHPFHYKRVQDLREEDFTVRMNFCQWVLNHQNVLHNILWSDEASFTRDKAFNIHNTHYWEYENPKVVRRTHFQHRFSVNIWAGIIGNRLIGPVVFPNRLTAQHYLHFLQNELAGLLEDIPLHTRLQMYYQQDGAPAHFGNNVKNWLDEKFPGRWIGRGSPITWPPRSPDLNPLDYFFWGFMCSIIYATEINTREELLDRINLAANQIKENTFQISRASQSIKKRSRLCIQQNGNLFENLL
ncbi:uncharacterized protein [Euwallacea fornicatus]|uniref:uncharacterized protein n=1 Tax=Euwallacea fornicatus TaxID=995702 RepID=UPI00338F1A55